MSLATILRVSRGQAGKGVGQNRARGGDRSRVKRVGGARGQAKGEGGHEGGPQREGEGSKGHGSFPQENMIALVHSNSLDQSLYNNHAHASRTCTLNDCLQLQLATAVLLGLEQWARAWCFLAKQTPGRTPWQSVKWWGVCCPLHLVCLGPERLLLPDANPVPTAFIHQN